MWSDRVCATKAHFHAFSTRDLFAMRHPTSGASQEGGGVGRGDGGDEVGGGKRKGKNGKTEGERDQVESGKGKGKRNF